MPDALFHTEPVLTVGAAHAMAAAALAHAQSDDLAVSVTVVDRSGQTLAVLRDHGPASTRCRPAIKRRTRRARKREPRR